MRVSCTRSMFVTGIASLVIGGALAVAFAEAPLPVRQVDQETLDEIQRQRARFASPLAGSSFEATDEQGQANAEAFAEAYQRVAGERPMLPALPPAGPATYASPDPRARYVTALRDAARLLDAAAADLEDAEAFAEADELRTRAQKLRLDAR